MVKGHKYKHRFTYVNLYNPGKVYASSSLPNTIVSVCLRFDFDISCLINTLRALFKIGDSLALPRKHIPSE